MVAMILKEVEVFFPCFFPSLTPLLTHVLLAFKESAFILILHINFLTPNKSYDQCCKLQFFIICLFLYIVLSNGVAVIQNMAK